MKAILGELAALGNVTDGLSDKLTKLQKMVEHHVKDEEGKVFPEARQVLGEATLQTLGQQITQAKQMSMPAVQNSVPGQELGLTGKAVM
jgi:hemerythrin superfamily protein